MWPWFAMNIFCTAHPFFFLAKAYGLWPICQSRALDEIHHVCLTNLLISVADPGVVQTISFNRDSTWPLTFIFCIVEHSVADPGVVQTNLMREVPTILSCLALRVLKFLRLLEFPKSGVDSIIDAALAPPVRTSVLLTVDNFFLQQAICKPFHLFTYLLFHHHAMHSQLLYVMLLFYPFCDAKASSTPHWSHNPPVPYACSSFQL